MNQILIYIFIGIGLSMDAFSISLAYGTNNIEKYKRLLIAILVGIFHFFMPIFGYYIFSNIFETFNINTNILVSIIFLLISIEMIISLKEETKNISMSFISIILFALTVSIDSFTVGIALSLEKSNIILASITFSIISLIFTYIGINIGNYLSNKVGKNAKIIGIIILLIFTVKYLL